MSKVKISGFYDEVSSDFKTQLALVRELGEEYICPRLIDGKNIADYTAEEFGRTVYPAMKEAGIKFSSIGSPIGKIALDDEEAFRKQLAQLDELIKIARLTGCKYIRTFSFFVKPDTDYDAVLDKVVSKTKKFAEKVEGTDIVLLHENEKHIYGDVPERVLKVYHGVNSPNYRLCYDASNYIQCKADPAAAYEATKEFTVYYHIKDCSEYGVEVPVGTGLGNYGGLFADLAQNGYDGFFTLEPHTAKYAILKPFVYFLPFAMFFMRNFYKGFRLIDKAMGVGYFKTVSRRQVFLWQYDGLKKLIDKYFDRK